MKQFNRELLDKFTYTLDIRNYSINTIENYKSVLKLFFEFTEKQSKDISINDLHCYLMNLHDSKRLSFSYHSQLVSAWKLYLSIIHDKKLKYKGKYTPRKSKNIINILSVSEVWMIIDSIKHCKQKAIISGIYLHGLRISEALKLRYDDIDKSRGLLIIREGKGKKDRLVPLSSEWLVYLKEYVKENKHKKGYEKCIFEPYSTTSISNVLKSKAKKLGIKKRVYPHLLRDCYASHLLQQGIDATFIQEILGHSRLETTRKYLHISAVNISKIALKRA